VAGEHRTEHPFDPRWLDRLADVCAILSHGNPNLQDLYLERRFELRVTNHGDTEHVEECRTEGMAVRWRFPNRTVLDAVSGVSSTALASLLSHFSQPPALPASHPGPAAEMDPPRGWRQWASGIAAAAGAGRVHLRYLTRQAVVVSARRWTTISSPALVRVELAGDRPGALLSVWNHPRLNRWIGSLSEPARARAWCPSSGSRTPVLFSGGTAGVLLHELVGHHAESDMVRSGGSPLAALHGAAITAPSIHLTDDPTRFDLPGGYSNDDEGVAAAPIPLVTAGRLDSWLCDSSGAEELGGAGGRGRRGSWYQPPAPRLSNLVVSPGNTPPEDLERDLQQGLLIERLGGASVDPVSSRLLLRVESGWEVNHGRKRRPLATFELTGSTLDVLAHIEPTIANDPTPDWRLGWCVKDGIGLATGSEAPTLLVHRLEVL
jgi:hypothetical protein